MKFYIIVLACLLVGCSSRPEADSKRWRVSQGERQWIVDGEPRRRSYGVIWFTEGGREVNLSPPWAVEEIK